MIYYNYPPFYYPASKYYPPSQVANSISHMKNSASSKKIQKNNTQTGIKKGIPNKSNDKLKMNIYSFLLFYYF